MTATTITLFRNAGALGAGTGLVAKRSIYTLAEALGHPHEAIRTSPLVKARNPEHIAQFAAQVSQGKIVVEYAPTPDSSALTPTPTPAPKARTMSPEANALTDAMQAEAERVAQERSEARHAHKAPKRARKATITPEPKAQAKKAPGRDASHRHPITRKWMTREQVEAAKILGLV